MKKILLSICIISTFYTYAQNELGLATGINYSTINLSEQNNADQNGKIGIYLGLYKKMALSEKLTFSPELLFSLQRTQFIYNRNSSSKDPIVPIGFRNNDGSVLEKLDVNINEYIIQLPFMFEYMLTQKLRFGIGPQIEYILLEQTSNNNNASYDLGELDNHRLGAGYAVNLGYELSQINRINFRYINRISIHNTLKSRNFQIGLHHSF